MRQAKSAGSAAVAAGALVMRARAAARAAAAARSLSTRSSELDTGSFRAAVVSLRAENYGQPAGEADAYALAHAKLVIFGELHSAPPCVELQRRTACAMLDAMASQGGGTLHMVWEHFNFSQQSLLDNYAAGRLSLPELIAQYEEGSEGHDLAPYESVLSLVREHPAQVAMHAGFIPRSYARVVMRESLDAALVRAKRDGFVADDERCAATDAHYSFFESLLTGRAYHRTSSQPPVDTYRKMFPAQVLKDAAMAHRVCGLLGASTEPRDRVLVICGIGHSGYSHGVPERILARHPTLREARATYRIWSLPADGACALDDAASVRRLLADAFGPPGSTDPADLCLAFKQVALPAAAEAAPSADDAEAVKAATAAAYNQVGQTAHLGGDTRRAVSLLRRMRYLEHEIAAAGADAANWQGVGCPHRHAHLRSGETVVDLGSGLGIDSFIAADAVGASGHVTGIDIAEHEVRHASTRAAARQLDGRVRFEVGDLERVPLPDASADAVISNGAFCLAPDKHAAFREAHRVLKPGGRMAVALSVIRAPAALEPGVHWPLCMRMFMDLAELRATCEAAGFAHVHVDESDSLMAFELPEAECPAEASGTARGEARAAAVAPDEDSERAQRRRSAVHVGSKEFEHLADFDMNAICARVVVVGVKV